MRFPDEFFKPSVIAFAMKIGRTTGILIRPCVAGKSTSRRAVGFQVSVFSLNSPSFCRSSAFSKHFYI